MEDLQRSVRSRCCRRGPRSHASPMRLRVRDSLQPHRTQLLNSGDCHVITVAIIPEFDAVLPFERHSEKMDLLAPQVG